MQFAALEKFDQFGKNIVPTHNDMLEVMQDGEWYSMDTSPGMAYTLEQLSLPAGGSKTDTHAWPCELFPGRFRVIKQFYLGELKNDVCNIAAEFVIE